MLLDKVSFDSCRTKSSGVFICSAFFLASVARRYKKVLFFSLSKLMFVGPKKKREMCLTKTVIRFVWKCAARKIIGISGLVRIGHENVFPTVESHISVLLRTLAYSQGKPGSGDISFNAVCGGGEIAWHTNQKC